MVKPRVVIAACLLAAVGGAGLYLSARAPEPQADARPQTFKVARREFVRGLRLSGTVEAVEATTISTPRLAGQNNNSLIITTLVRAGLKVRPGDLLVEFDRQEQMRNALDKQAELNDLEQQVRKRRAQEDAAKAADDSTLKQAESAQQRAQLEILKNEMLPKIEAEKNVLALEEAKAKFTQLQQTYSLKRQAAAADIKVLEIRRDRAQTAMQEAASNSERMLIKSPIEGIAVIKTTWKNRTMAEIQEGDEVRAGVPVVDVVNPAAMRVRARVNQADIDNLRVAQPVHVGLDAYPDLTFNGHIDQISPIGAQSNMSPKVRNFVVLVGIDGAHPNLMPDLTASLDVQLAHQDAALVVPIDAVGHDGTQAFVRVQRGGGFERQNVSVAGTNTHEVVVTQGLMEGNVIARNIGEAAK